MYLNALKLEKIIKEKYYTKASVNNSQSHVMAQTDYIESKYTSNPIAFLLEGPWWENEVRVSGGVEAVVENQGKEADPANRNFGFFPMPKATQAQVGQKTTFMLLFALRILHQFVTQAATHQVLNQEKVPLEPHRFAMVRLK